ncbi:MAG: IS30 family transposase, partial [Enterococcus sp.]|nr:IS30 family transposase [Enterococcus sp.]
IYRWVSRKYGGLSSTDLSKKVKYKKRKQHQEKKPTAHGKSRSYEAFCQLPMELQLAAWEMDTVMGMQADEKCILTKYHRPSKFQFALLMPAKTISNVFRFFNIFERAIGKEQYKYLFKNILTDNGGEFSDYVKLEKSLFGGKRNKIYYCDVRESQQKGACEKNHVELRKILPKGKKISFDMLDNHDMRHLMSHMNSQPRESLGGKSPIEMFKFIAGEPGTKLIEILGIEEIPFKQLNMRPEMLNEERRLRGLTPIK